MIKLRDYQNELYTKCHQCFVNGNKRILLQSPCGSGKSFIFIQMCISASKKGNVLILVHRKELKEQHIELFKSFNVNMSNIRVALFYSEYRQLGMHDKPNMIVCDEAHWIPKTLRKVLDYYDCCCVGFTATPTRLQNDSMGDVYEQLITGVSVKYLINNNCLSPYEYYAPTLIDVTRLTTKGNDYDLEDCVKALSNKAIYGNILKTFVELAKNKKTIAYCSSIKHSKEIVELFNDNGFKACHIDGTMSKKERNKIMFDFRNGKIQIISNVNLIIEGISVDDCECCLLLRPTMSVTIYIQSAMRCMRYKEGKKAIIIDYVSNYFEHGLPDDDREWSLDGIQKKRRSVNEDGSFTVRSCPKCYKIFQTANKCPYCGYEYEVTGRELKQMQEVELKRITEEEKVALEKQKKIARMEVGKARTKAELIKIAQSRGYAMSWVAIQCRLKHIR